MRLKFLVFAWVLSFAAHGQKVVPELWNLRVHDDAHVLRHETMEQLETRLAQYEDSTSNQIAILIISSLEGEVLEEYSIKVAEKWALGQKDNGVLLLIAVDDHKMRIEVGAGLEGALTDAMSSRIIRNEMAPAFRRGDFDSGVTAAIEGIIKAIGGEYTAEDADSETFEELGLKTRILIGLGLFLFFGLFAFFALVTKGGTGWGLYAFLIPFYTLFYIPLMNSDSWYVPGLTYILGFPILKLWVNRTRWGKNIAKKMMSGSSSGGGGWSSSGSGSSWGSSSGGGFSGGGGSFGGGGSSGSW